MRSRILKGFLIVIGIVVAAAVIFFAVITIAEYKPDDVEVIDVSGEASAKLKSGSDLKVITWNVGYGSLGETADFFMDGGKSVNTATREETEANMAAIIDELKAGDYDLMALQEVDLDSARSNSINEVALVGHALEGYQYTFGRNFKAFVPYPLPPLGKVDSGIMTLSKYGIEAADRVSLPNPFSWPIRTCNLKRCVTINRIPIADSEKELVFVNLHLEAYDDGDGKIEQTKVVRGLLNEEVAKGNYVIACGDFNQEFSTVDPDKYPDFEGLWAPGRIDISDFGEDWTLVMDDETPTCRSLDKPIAGADRENFQYYVIDGFIVSGNIEMESVETLDMGFKYTDHNPVVTKLKLK